MVGTSSLSTDWWKPSLVASSTPIQTPQQLFFDTVPVVVTNICMNSVPLTPHILVRTGRIMCGPGTAGGHPDSDLF